APALLLRGKDKVRQTFTAPPHRHDDKVWGSTCAQAKKSQATSAHSALTDEDGIFRDVLSVKE
ncbi:MAG: hypothetical protein JZU67_02780, partial [Burkholderiaceae bacterium]|nr:hypothetical protein [Burkholderiaceae bacterium]